MRNQVMSLGVVMMVTFAAPVFAQDRVVAETPAAAVAAPPSASTDGAARSVPTSGGDHAWTLAQRAAREEEERAPVRVAQPGEATETYSPGMVVGGSVLTVIGGLSASFGVAGLASGGGGEMAGLGQIVGGAFLGGGVLFLGIGIPLIVSGSEDVPVEGPDAAAAPQLRVGAGSVDFSVGF